MREHVESLLALFLSSRGIDTTTISGKPQAEKYGSGVERLLGMLEKFEASREDMAIFERVEDQLFEVIRAWHNEAPSLFDDTYISARWPEDASVSVTFATPEMIQTEKEKLDLWIARKDAGINSMVDVVMSMNNMSKDEAIEKLKEVQDEKIDRMQAFQISAPFTRDEDVEDQEDTDQEDDDANIQE